MNTLQHEGFSMSSATDVMLAQRYGWVAVKGRENKTGKPGEKQWENLHERRVERLKKWSENPAVPGSEKWERRHQAVDKWKRQREKWGYGDVGEAVADDMFGVLTRDDLFGADDVDDEPSGLAHSGFTDETMENISDDSDKGFKFKPPSWVLPAAGGLAAGAGLTALGFALFKKKKKDKYGADARVVDSRAIDSRATPPDSTEQCPRGRGPCGACRHPGRGRGQYGQVGTYDLLGDQIASEMFGSSCGR